MSNIRITLFGPLTVRVAGDIVDVRGPRPRAVLARLAVAAGSVVSTDRIIDDIWDGEPPPKALGGLQVHISNLRRVLEPQRERRSPAQTLVSAAPGYALRLPVDAVDTWRFEACLRDAESTAEHAHRAGLLRAALDCWTGEVLSEFADSDWAAAEITRLNALRSAALEQYASIVLDSGGASTILPELERHVADEPLREEAVRLLALALYRSGRQSDALAHLRASRERLADELGIDPSPALRTLELKILEHSTELLDRRRTVPVPSAPVMPTHPSPPSAPHRHRATMVGRSAELDRIDAAANTALAHGLRAVWVGAEAGAGKTTLAQVVADRLSQRGWTIAQGRCPEVDGAPPAWAWSEVVRSLDAPAPTLGSAFEIAAAVGDQLREAACAGPLLIVLDDLHRADGATLQLLRGFAHDLADRPILVLIAYRDTEVDADLSATFAALAAVTAERLQLGGLSREGITELVREHAPACDYDQDVEVLDRLIERTGGNPLFVTEFARLLAAEGRGAAGASVPQGVRDVLRRRLSRLPGTARTVLQQAAVLGRDLDVELLLRIAHRAEDEVLDGLEAAVLAGLLSEPGPGQVRFTHALVRDTLYEDTPALRRARWHATALTELRATPGQDITTLAHHALAAATPSTAADAALLASAAADQAMQLNAPAQALQLAQAAVRMVDLSDQQVPVADQVRMLIQITGAAAQYGASATARPARARALALAAGDTDLELAALTSYRAPISWTVAGIGVDGNSIEQSLRRALTMPTDASTRVWLLVALIFETENDAAAYGMDEVVAWSQEALSIARAGDDAIALCAALNARAYLSLGPDLADEREALSAELLSVAQTHGLLGYQALAHWLLFMCASARTDLTEAMRQADLAVEHSTSGQLASLVQVLQVYQAVLSVLAGRLTDAERAYRRLAQQMAETGMTSAAEAAIVFEMVLAFARNDLSGLTGIMLALHDAHPDAMNEALVLCLLDSGREDEARQHWQQRTPVRRNYYWLARMALFTRAAVRIEDADACAGAYRELLPWAGRIAGIDSGSVAFGTVDDALALLADALGRPGDAARHRAESAAVLTRVAADLTPRSPSPSDGNPAAGSPAAR